MLHILWLIFKVILILLGVILGLALLILLLVLFCPIRYRVYAEKAEEAPFKEAAARVRVSWLFGGVSANASLESGTLRVFAKLFFLTKTLLTKNFFGQKETGNTAGQKPAAQAAETKPEPPDAPETSFQQEAPVSEAETSSGQEDADAEPEIPADVIQVEPILPEDSTAPGKDDETQKAEAPAEESTAFDNPAAEETEPQVLAEKQKKAGILQKISGALRSIRKKISDIKKKISGAMTKAAWWRDFIFHEKTKAAVALILREAKFLVRHVLPKRIRGRLRFGFEDPSITGKILAFMGATYPRHRNSVALTPVFENRTVIDGKTEISGRIYLVVFAAAAVKIILSRNVRFVIRTFKNRNR